MKIYDQIFSQFPAIQTKRLLLREIMEDDLQEIFKIYSDDKLLMSIMDWIISQKQNKPKR